MKPLTRIENFLAKIAGNPAANAEMKPRTRKEYFLNEIAAGSGYDLVLIGNNGTVYPEENVLGAITIAKGSIEAAAAKAKKAEKQKAEKELLKAYTGFSEDMKPTIISDKIDSGKITFTVEAGMVPPFFTKLFKVSLYDGVKMTIDDAEVRERFGAYLRRALKVCD